MGSAMLETARPPGPWRQYPSSPEYLGVKNGQFNLGQVPAELCILNIFQLTSTQ